jgi:hypothetical protein
MSDPTSPPDPKRPGKTVLYHNGKPIASYSDPPAPRQIRNRPTTNLDPNVFIGPKLKIKRAKGHIDDLEAAIKTFNDGKPYDLVHEVDTNTGENVYRVRVKERVPIDLSTIIGDAVHNLRTVLDYLVCDLIRAHGKIDANNGGLPIDKRAKRHKPGTVGKIKGVTPKAEHLIPSA